MNLLHSRHFLLFLPLFLAAAPAETFSDEFDGTGLDLSRWSAHAVAPAGPVSGVPEVSSGYLRLRAGQTITTYGLFSETFGHFEIRWRFTRNAGVQPVFRLLPVPYATLPAIDILSASEEGLVAGNRWGTEQTTRSFSDNLRIAGDGLHVIAVDWSAESIVWRLDGKEHLRSTAGVPTGPMFLELGAQGGGGGTVDVDFVRVGNAPASAKVN